MASAVCRRRVSAVLAVMMLAVCGCARDTRVATVTLDMDRDRRELPRTAERVKLRRAENMILRVELINSTDKPVPVERIGSGNNISGVNPFLYRNDVMLEGKVTTTYQGGIRFQLEPSQSVFHDIEFYDYAPGDCLGSA